MAGDGMWGTNAFFTGPPSASMSPSDRAPIYPDICLCCLGPCMGWAAFSSQGYVPLLGDRLGPSHAPEALSRDPTAL